MDNLAVIPARGGSKRIPKKNIKHFLGKPIIAYSIETAIHSDLFDKVIVSTDDPEIANISSEYGAQVPFYRTTENSDDYATLPEVIEEVILNLESEETQNYDNICCILPTAPLVSIKQLTMSLKELTAAGTDGYSVTPVVAFSYPIWRSLKIDDNNNLRMIWPEYLKSRSQDLTTAYHDAGAFYWIKYRQFKEEKVFFTSRNIPFFMNNLEAQDIDNMDDWRLAELKYRLLYE